MKCPVCNTVDLVMTERQGIEIDYCPTCRGVWLDRGELDKIIERSDRDDDDDDARRRSAPPPPQQAYGHHAPPPPPHYGAPQYGHGYGYKKKKSWWHEIFD